MDYRGLTHLCVKLIGVWLLIQGIMGIPNIYLAWASIKFQELQGVSSLSITQYVFASAIPIIFGAICLFWPIKIEKFMLASKPTMTGIDRESKLLFCICLTLLGVYFLSGAIQKSIKIISLLVVLNPEHDSLATFLGSKQLEASLYGDIFATLFLWIISIGLIWKSGFIVSKLRSAIWDAIKFPEVVEEAKQYLPKE